ncbi:LysM peptidoglycan-binding domain-containing protein [Paenibacillus sp. R14(2021)]|uniref:LysM peptidoglycan-binding domain-containing protein n=1 Tax=Paenibacillus sp. R14(2021) TaxID=2859228 RepID=UPI001C61667F|nr:LysM peptidoglycan-binding domain-containing protein [Paenibacillus sp. R14(2021)]
MSSNSTGNDLRPRTSRSSRNKEDKAPSKMLMATIAFLIVICAVLYGIYSSHSGSGQKHDTEALAPADGGQGQAGSAAQGNTDKPGTGNNDTATGGTTDNSDASNPPAADNAGGTANASDSAGEADGTDAASSPEGDTTGNAAADAPVDAGQGEPTQGKPAQPSSSNDKPEHADSQAPAASGHADKLPTTYVVQKGDTLSTISMKFYHSKRHVAFLAKSNHLVFINDMKVGDTIKIPVLSSSAGSSSGNAQDNVDYSKVTLPASYLVRPGDTLYRIAMLFYHSDDDIDLIVKANKLKTNEDLKAGTSLIIPAKPRGK